MVALYRQLEEMLAAIPGVQSVAMSNIAIVGDGHSGSTFHKSGTPTSKNEAPVQTNSVGADFFETMGIAVLEGRSFNAHEMCIRDRSSARQFSFSTFCAAAMEGVRIDSS